jgi:hypothetical protein
VPDAKLGVVHLQARLFDGQKSSALVVVVHGLGGSSKSAYVARARLAAEQARAACLLVDLRGADLLGEDIYHAGLSSDLSAVLGSPALAQYASLHLLGYSLGGHLALRAATEPLDARVASVAAICAPLDLAASAAAFDRAACWPYRQYVLGALKTSYAAVARRRGSVLPVERIRRIRSIRVWDSTVVAPRFGFASAADYYARASVAPVLDHLRVPCLYVAALADPMVPFATVSPALERRPPRLDVRQFASGGHVGFPARCDLGFGGELGLERQVIAWLLASS